MTIENIIAEGVVKAVKELYGADVEPKLVAPSATKKEFEGDLTVVVFPLLKISRKAPDATATEIGEWIGKNIDAVERFNVVKGFLNITVSPAFWLGLPSNAPWRPPGAGPPGPPRTRPPQYSVSRSPPGRGGR